MKLLIKIISLYQRTLSPDHGIFARPYGHCPFYPTCSEYAKQSIQMYGVLRGTIRGLRRILKCYPGRLPAVDLP